MKQLRTKIKDQDHKIDIIEHVNEDHTNALYEIVYAHSKYKKITSVTLNDLFEEGGLLNIEVKKGVFEELYVPFTIKGELEEKILYLAYKAMIDNGKPLVSSKKQYFEVVENTFVTKNMLRLTIKSANKISTAPAFAYLFSLKKLEKIRKTSNKPAKVNVFTKLYAKVFLFVIKLLSSKQRSNLLRSMNKNNRYYTVRKAWKKDNDYYAFIDIYIHEKTNGGEWAKSLQQSDVIISINEYKEKSQHLNQGKALLIADETSLPAIGAILEQWRNPILPEVIVVTNSKEEELYLNEIENKQYNIHYLSNSENLYKTIIQTIEKLNGIEAVWGALEKNISKELKKYVRKTLKIDAKNNRIIGYWKKDVLL